MKIIQSLLDLFFIIFFLLLKNIKTYLLTLYIFVLLLFIFLFFLSSLFSLLSSLFQGLHSVGSCALVVVVIGRHLITAHIGDCRAVVTGALRLCRVKEIKKEEKDKEEKDKEEKEDTEKEDMEEEDMEVNMEEKEFKRTGAMTLTKDHTCLNKKEVVLIQHRSTDPYPVRFFFLFSLYFTIKLYLLVNLCYLVVRTDVLLKIIF